MSENTGVNGVFLKSGLIELFRSLKSACATFHNNPYGRVR